MEIGGLMFPFFQDDNHVKIEPESKGIQPF